MEIPIEIQYAYKHSQRKSSDAFMQSLKPLNDFIFGKVFGKKGDEEQLLSLPNAILAKAKHKKLVAAGKRHMDIAIHKIHEKMTFLFNDKETLRFYIIRKMAQIDYNSGLRKAKKQLVCLWKK